MVTNAGGLLEGFQGQLQWIGLLIGETGTLEIGFDQVTIRGNKNKDKAAYEKYPEGDVPGTSMYFSF